VRTAPKSRVERGNSVKGVGLERSAHTSRTVSH